MTEIIVYSCQVEHNLWAIGPIVKWSYSVYVNLASHFTLPQYLVELFKRATKDIAEKAIETKMLRVEVQHVFAQGIIS